MGVDAKIYLPGNTRLSTVVEVIAKCLDAPLVKKKLRDDKPGDNYWHVSVGDDVVEYHNVVQGLAGVTIKRIDPSLHGYDCFGFSYHYEFGGYKNMGACRGIILRSRSYNIALLMRLADFFGGVVDFQDCDDEERDYVVKDKPDSKNCPEDGEPWQNLQERIWAVKPLTQEEIDKCEKFAAYKEEARDKRLAMKRKDETTLTIEVLAKQLGQPADIVANILKKGGVL